MGPTTDIALVGCGYVADFYVQTLANHPQLRLAGVFDRDADRMAAHATHHGVPTYPSLDALLADPAVTVVANLTNPREHAALTHRLLDAGKHVYSEKPLGMTFDEAVEVVAHAERVGLELASAPCNVLGEAAQTVWRALRAGDLGEVHAVYAEMDDGLVHRRKYRAWANASGARWPWRDEFEVGCTFEHAGYYLTWLCAFFGPVLRMTAASTVAVTDKRTDTPIGPMAPDLSVGVLEFDGGVVARLTCSIVAPEDRVLRIFGEDANLYVRDCWDYGSEIVLTGQQDGWRGKVGRRARRELGRVVWNEMPPEGRRLPLARSVSPHLPSPGWPMDFARGVADLADAVHAGRRPSLPADFSLHVTELTEALQHPDRVGTPYVPQSSFAPLDPQPWAA